MLGVVPKVARLKGIEVKIYVFTKLCPVNLKIDTDTVFQGLVDAKQYYYDLTTVTDYK